MNAIRHYREILKLSQEQLASELGIDRSTVAKWETGESMPRASMLPKIAELFGCSIDDLFKEAKEAG